MDFGYLASSVMHFYAIGFREFLKLPIYTFWALARNIDRIRAEEDRRLFVLLTHLMSKNPQAFCQSLIQEQGTIVETEQNAGLDGNPEFDRSGFERMRALFGGIPRNARIQAPED